MLHFIKENSATTHSVWSGYLHVPELWTALGFQIASCVQTLVHQREKHGKELWDEEPGQKSGFLCCTPMVLTYL